MKTLEDVLEEIAPQPEPDFVAAMESRLRGFSRPEGKSSRRVPRLRMPTLRPRAWAAAAASAMLALTVTVSLIGGGGGQHRTDNGGAAFETQAAPDRALPAAPDAATERDAPAARTLTTTPPVPGHEDVAPNAATRRVERSAQLNLAADPSDFDGLADSIFRTADRHDGFVLRSSFSQGEDGASGGFFELRVPADELQPTLTELSRLATVRARSESGNDVTAGFISLRDRVRTAQAERKSLLRRLELAVTDTAVVAIRRRLAIVGRKITSLAGQLRGARERTEFATVTVDLVDENAGAASGDTDEAVDDAVGSLEDIANFLIRAMGVLLPLVLAGFFVWLGLAVTRRRARERALS